MEITSRDIVRLTTASRVAQCVADRCNGDPDLLVEALSREVNHLLATDLRKAWRLLAPLRRCFRFLPERYQANLLAIQGRLQHSNGRHVEAAETYGRAIQRFKASGNHFAAARTRQGLMDVYMYLGRYDEAIATGKQSLRYFRRTGRLQLAARVMTNLGNVYHRLDKNRVALGYYAKAREVFRPAGGTQLATVEFNLANIYANMNQLDHAERLYRNAGDIYRQAGLSVFYYKARYSLAYLHFIGDRYTSALRMMEEVYAAFVALGDLKAAAVTRLDLVEINIHLNQYATAVLHGQEIIPQFAQLGMRYEQAKATFFVALAKLNLRDLREASELLRKARNLFHRERNELWQGMVSLARSKLHLSAGRPSLALRSLREARKLFVLSGNELRTVDADIMRAEALSKSGRERRADRMVRKLLAGRRVGYQAYRLHVIAGQLHFENGRLEKALEAYRRAVTVVERMLAGLYWDEIRHFFVSDKLTPFLGIVDTLLRLGKVRGAFLTSLQAQMILNERSPASQGLRLKVPEHLLKAREKLRAALRKTGGFPHGSHAESSDVSAYSKRERELWSMESRIRARMYKATPGSRHRKTYQRLRRCLDRVPTVISYHSAPDGAIGAFCNSGRKVTYTPLGLNLSGLRRHLAELYFIFERAVLWSKGNDRIDDAMTYYLRQLHSWLLGPILPRCVGESIYLVVDGIFAQIPYVALQDDTGTSLRDTYNLSIIVNPQDLVSAETPERSFGSCRNAVFAVSSPELPAIDVETKGIQRLFKRSVLVSGEKATSHALKRELARATGFVHIASHASRSSENPLFSQIALSDGPFYPFDLFATGIRARLVSLSGCQTAATGKHYGTSFSLAKAFNQAGSRAVLATLWPISDHVSMEFITEFYRVLRETNGITVSYRAAINKIAESYRNPALWSSFILLGR